MRIPLISDARSMREAVRSGSPERRDDSGLTTLEWLLIVAAVAGLAALAVVLVTNVVSDTAEQIAGSSARRTAAALAADEIVLDAVRDVEEQPADAKTYGKWAAFYKSKCERLRITYGDAGLTVEANFTYSNLSSTDSVVAASIASIAQTAKATVPAAATGAVAQCLLT